MRWPQPARDEDRAGTRSVSWSWGDGSGAQAGRVAGANGLGNASSSHSFAAPGIYRVAATVTDGSGRSTTVSRTVVVAAPSSGTVAGTGAIMSPPGALKRSPSHAVPVGFSLIAPSTTGARAGGMPARLQFDLPGWNFRSDSIRLAGRQGALHVFEGSGTVRGKGGYRFRLATDAGAAGGAGRFALRIWHTDPASKAEVVDYDNGRAPVAARGSRLSTGSVVLD